MNQALRVLLVLASFALVADGQQNGEVSSQKMALDKGRHQSANNLGISELISNGAPKNLQYLDANGQPVLVQFTYVGPPKILPIATADSYPEGSTINLICTVSGGQRKGLTLNWFKDNQELDDQSVRYPTIGQVDNLSIEKTGADISILRITNATHANSGRFTCKAANPLGEDSTSVNIIINVELKWSKLPVDNEVGLDQDLSIECDAVGQPQPQITWTKHPSSTIVKGPNDPLQKTIVVSQNKLLRIAKAQLSDSGLYECVARNGVDQDLRRIVQIKIRGPVWLAPLAQ